MNVRVVLGNRSYGGYEFKNYSINMDYENFDWDRLHAYLEIGSYFFSDEQKGKIKKELENILLGQIAPRDIRDKDDVIVYKGEKVAKLHIITIINSLESIKWNDTPWADAVGRIKQDILRQKIRFHIKEGKEIFIKFKFDKNSRQDSGSLYISPQVAQWLGEQLIKASQGELAFRGISARVQNNVIVTEKKTNKK